MSNKNLAERCFAHEETDPSMELFETVNEILGADVSHCLEEGFKWQATDTWYDAYDGSVEVVRDNGCEWMTPEQAGKILDLGFYVIYESMEGEARHHNRAGWSAARAREGSKDNMRDAKLKAALNKLTELDAQIAAGTIGAKQPDPTALRKLAEGCHNGACNWVGLLNSLAEAVRGQDLRTSENKLYVKYAIGHISHLLGESLGPSEETVREMSRATDAGYGQME